MWTSFRDFEADAVVRWCLSCVSFLLFLVLRLWRHTSHPVPLCGAHSAARSLGLLPERPEVPQSPPKVGVTQAEEGGVGSVQRELSEVAIPSEKKGGGSRGDETRKLLVQAAHENMWILSLKS